MNDPAPSPFVSRGGEKLSAALDAFVVDPTGWVCADLGCNVGGFTDCLLQRGARKVYAIDTGYGALAWRLRKDERVVVMERTNALHVELPEPVDLVTIDVAWTRQHLILPVALRLLSPGGHIISLIKPHYEAERSDLRSGVLPAEKLNAVLDIVRDRVGAAGLQYAEIMESPIQGRKGNRELLGILRT
ncbi:MAG: methyltransferase domain-containing protein [Phycisphaerales bacterium]|nr:methyltransferase domain-containing protein [Phycisphaerales bacterium]